MLFSSLIFYEYMLAKSITKDMIEMNLFREYNIKNKLKWTRQSLQTFYSSLSVFF